MNKKYNIKKLVFRIMVFSFAALLMSCNRGKALTPSNNFGAYYTHIVTSDEFEKYSRTGDYADIIVDLGKENGKFIFWRGSSYLPYWETVKGEKVYVDEIIPRSGDDDKSESITTHNSRLMVLCRTCNEQISGRKCRYYYLSQLSKRHFAEKIY